MRLKYKWVSTEGNLSAGSHFCFLFCFSDRLPSRCWSCWEILPITVKHVQCQLILSYWPLCCPKAWHRRAESRLEALVCFVATWGSFRSSLVKVPSLLPFTMAGPRELCAKAVGDRRLGPCFLEASHLKCGLPPGEESTCSSVLP